MNDSNPKTSPDRASLVPTALLSRLSPLRLTLGGVTFTLAPLSSAQAAYLRAQLEAQADDGTPAEFHALRFAVTAIEGLQDADGAPLHLRFESIELWGRTYRCICPTQWRGIWHLLPPWVTDRLGAEMIAQSYLGDCEKKASSCTCGSASTACAVPEQGSCAPSAQP